MALLLEYYRELPQPREEEKAAGGFAHVKRAIDSFRKKVAARYTEGTLQRLLTCGDAETRRATVLALGLVGMAQCFIKLRKPRPALRALRSALKINPGLEGVADTIRALEEVLGEEGKKDDKK